ncbi:uncharacterized protein TNCV_4273481 [Trichonephila clavipes]|nr:uncharacterized protein TNCV_4273481 [Trichonephila clavipes]
MWFQHDGAPAHFSTNARSVLDAAYPGRWIGWNGPPVDSDEALVASIAVVAGEIREIPGVFANVRHSLRRRSASSAAFQAQVAPSLGAPESSRTIRRHLLKDFWDRGARYVCRP